jgi:hypothetical protein
MSNAWILAPIVVIDVLCAANVLILLVLRQYIGAANQLAPIYWRCKHLKNPQSFKSCKMSVCLHLLVLPWCYDVGSTQYIGATCAGSTNISPYRFVYHMVKCTVFGRFFHYCEWV